MRPDLVAEITLQPVRRYGVDAAILYSDIMVPLKAAGVDLDIVSGRGPVIARPVRGPGDLDQIAAAGSPRDLWYVTEAVGLLVAELGADAADRVRRGAVHPGQLSGRGRAEQGLRADQVDDGQRAGAVARPVLPAGRGLRDVPAGAGRRRRLGGAAVRLVGGQPERRRLRALRPALLGRRCSAPLADDRRTADPFRRRHLGAARPDGRGRRRGGRGRLAAAAGRGQPPDRAGVRGAGQSRPGAAGGPVAGAGASGCARCCAPAPRRPATSSTWATGCRPTPIPACWPGSSTWCTPRARAAPRLAARGGRGRLDDQVAVVGGGITGLAAARRLARRGLRGHRPGGRRRAGAASWRRSMLDGVRLDGGAESMLARRPEAVALVDDLGLGPRRWCTRPAPSRPLLVGGAVAPAAAVGAGRADRRRAAARAADRDGVRAARGREPDRPAAAA